MQFISVQIKCNIYKIHATNTCQILKTKIMQYKIIGNERHFSIKPRNIGEIDMKHIFLCQPYIINDSL